MSSLWFIYPFFINMCPPVCLEMCYTFPLHKGGDPHDINNYRPISIINSIAKIFEKLIFNQLTWYIKKSNILPLCQYGFRPNFSTTTALLNFTNDVFTASENGKLTAIFLDLIKSFAIVDHYLLLDKLHSVGVSINALQCFMSATHTFITDVNL